MKLQFLPALPVRVWYALWAIAMFTIAGDWIGSRLLGLFEFSQDVSTACLIAFALLAFTPLHFPPRTVWAVITPTGWVEVSEQEARRLRAQFAHEPRYRVRRLIVQSGKVLEEHEL